MRALHAFYTCQALEQRGIENRFFYLFFFPSYSASGNSSLRATVGCDVLHLSSCQSCLTDLLTDWRCRNISVHAVGPRSRFPRLSDELTNSGDFKSCQWNISRSSSSSSSSLRLTSPVWPPSSGPEEGWGGPGMKAGIVAGWDRSPPRSTWPSGHYIPQSRNGCPPFLLTPGWRPIMDTLVSP